MPSRAPSPSLARSPGLCLPTRHEPRYRCSRSRPAPDRHTGSPPTRRPCRRGPSSGGTGPVRLVMPGGVAHFQPLFGLMLQRRPIRARRIPRRPAAPTCSADLPRRHDDRRTRRHGGWGRARRAVARRRPYAGLSPPGRGTNTMSPSVVTNRWVRGEAASADPRVAVRPSEKGFVRELCRVHTSWTPRQRPDL